MGKEILIEFYKKKLPNSKANLIVEPIIYRELVSSLALAMFNERLDSHLSGLT